jgi:hypothetical protein
MVDPRPTKKRRIDPLDEAYTVCINVIHDIHSSD